MQLTASEKRDWRYFRNLLLVAIGGLLLGVYIILPIYMANRALHPTRFPIGDDSPAKLGLDYEDITLTTNDNVPLSGWYIPSKNGAAVIAVHAYNGNRTGVIYHADLLVQHGYGVLLFDLRAHGESGGDTFPFGWNADRDVMAALAYLQNRPEVDPSRIGTLGLSIGGEVVLQASAKTDQIKAVVAEGSGARMFEETFLVSTTEERILAPGYWIFFKAGQFISGTSPAAPLTELVPQIAPRPLLLISAGADREINRVYYAVANEPKTLWERPEAGHIEALFAHPEEYEEQVITFFNRALLERK